RADGRVPSLVHLRRRRRGTCWVELGDVTGWALPSAAKIDLLNNGHGTPPGFRGVRSRQRNSATCDPSPPAAGLASGTGQSALAAARCHPPPTRCSGAALQPRTPAPSARLELGSVLGAAPPGTANHPFRPCGLRL